MRRDTLPLADRSGPYSPPLMLHLVAPSHNTLERLRGFAKLAWVIYFLSNGGQRLMSITSSCSNWQSYTLPPVTPIDRWPTEGQHAIYSFWEE